MKKEMVTCNVSNDRCSSPAGWGINNGFSENDDRTKQARFICFACGLPACGHCSKLIEYMNFGKQRICDTCRQ